MAGQATLQDLKGGTLYLVCTTTAVAFAPHSSSCSDVTYRLVISLFVEARQDQTKSGQDLLTLFSQVCLLTFVALCRTTRSLIIIHACSKPFADS